MKKIIGIILLVLFFIGFWVGMSFVFYNGGLDLWLSIILPFCCYVAAVLIMAFTRLIAWLLT
jgi:hypothetical protein